MFHYPHYKTITVTLIFLVSFSTGILGAFDTRVSVDGDAFTIESERLRVTFSDGMIVEARNLLTGELHSDLSAKDRGMPRGLGHLRGGVDNMEHLHTPWHGASMTLRDPDTLNETPKDRDYPTLFRPADDALFSTRAIDNGIEATWRGLTNGTDLFPEDKLVVSAWVDRESGHILFQAYGESVDKGVYGIQVPLANLADYHDFYIPSFSGVMINRYMNTGIRTFRGLCNFLEARVIGIEGKYGTLGLWAQDDQFYNHHLFMNWSGRTFSVAFQHENLMPFEEHDTVDSVVYYLDAFSGGWVDAMTPYRDWYKDLFSEEINQRGQVEWADDIRVIIDSFSRNSETYSIIAERFEPGTVMFHEWNARSYGFDRGLPDMLPAEGYPERVRMIQEFGFKTMAYVNSFCVNYNSDTFIREQVETFGLTRKGHIRNYSRNRIGEDQESQWENIPDGRLLYLDSLSPQWRAYHTDKMIEWKRATGVDANYVDVLGTAGDHGNGVIDGLFAGQGAAAQVRELLNRNHEVPMASEYSPENIAFGVRWPLTYLTVWGGTNNRVFWYERSRPVAAFIFGPGLRPWIPVIRAQDNTRHHWVMGWSDAMGGLAQTSGHIRDLHVSKGSQALLNYRAGLFSSLLLEPYFEPMRYEDNLVGMYMNKEGEVYGYHVNEGVQEMVSPEGLPLYQRIHGKNTFSSPLTIYGWPARDGDVLLGLNPQTYYPLMPKEGDPGTDIRITRLPEGIMVRRYYDGDGFSVLSLERIDGSSPSNGSIQFYAEKALEGVMVNDIPVRAPAWNELENRTVAEEYEIDFPAYLIFYEQNPETSSWGYLEPEVTSGLHIIPTMGIDNGLEFNARQRRLWDVPDQGGSGQPGREAFRRTSSIEEVTIDYWTKVPDDETMLLVYLRNENNIHGNGVIGRLYLNGKLVRAYDFGAISNPEWGSGIEHSLRDLWPEKNVHMWRVPLGQYAGKPLLITMGTDYKNETNADNFWWSRPVFVKDAGQESQFMALLDDGEFKEEEGFRVLPADFIMNEKRSHSPGGY